MAIQRIQTNKSELNFQKPEATTDRTQENSTSTANQAAVILHKSFCRHCERQLCFTRLDFFSQFQKIMASKLFM